MSEEIAKVGMKPSHPGEFIREEILAELGLSIALAAEILGVRRATLSDLVNCHAALSPEMALRIEKAFGVGLEKMLSPTGTEGSNPSPSTGESPNLRSPSRGSRQTF